MPLIQRLTTQYDAAEDRLRLAIDTADAGTMVLWLTQRLSHSLIAHLCAWLEQPGALTTPGQPAQHSSSSSTSQQTMAQQIAAAQMQAAPTVLVTDGQPHWLLTAVRVSCNAKLVQLNFTTNQNDAPEPRLIMAAPALRQWLGVVHEQYRVAGWPLERWPAWMQTATLEAQQRPAVLH